MKTPDQNKRYYWLKLSEDFFRQKEIKQLRRMAGGDTFTIIYLKMLLRSMKDGGKLYYEGFESDFVSELALDIDEEIENVKLTVTYLAAKEILVQGKPDEYELLTANEMTGSEGDSARRMRKLRARNLLTSHCDAPVTARDVEIEIDKDIETETEKRDRGRTARSRFTPPTVGEVEDYAKEKGWNETEFSAERFVDYYESVGWMVGNKKHMKDWRASARGWVSREKKQSAQSVTQNPALNYQQREYRDEDFGEDFYFNYDKFFGQREERDNGSNQV